MVTSQVQVLIMQRIRVRVQVYKREFHIYTLRLSWSRISISAIYFKRNKRIRREEKSNVSLSVHLLRKFDLENASWQRGIWYICLKNVFDVRLQIGFSSKFLFSLWIRCRSTLNGIHLQLNSMLFIWPCTSSGCAEMSLLLETVRNFWEHIYQHQVKRPIKVT